MSEQFAERDYLYGAAKPEPDGWINPHRVSVTGTLSGAQHRAKVLGDGHVVVRRLVVEWEAVAATPSPTQRVRDGRV